MTFLSATEVIGRLLGWAPVRRLFGFISNNISLGPVLLDDHVSHGAASMAYSSCRPIKSPEQNAICGSGTVLSLKRCRVKGQIPCLEGS